MADDKVKLSILDKIKLLMWLNNLCKGGSKMGKLLEKVDGLKSVAGLLMVTAYYALPQFGVHPPEIVLKIGSGLAGIGLAHKLEKGTGVLSKGIDVASKGLDVLKKVLDAVSKKEEKPEDKK